MIDNAFRELLPRFASPLVKLYTRLGLTPNGVSFVALGIALLAAGCVAIDWPMAAVILWWLGRLADGTDGIYARATGQATDFGAYLDILLDMAAYGVMVIAFDIAHPEWHGRWLAMLFLYILCITSALALGMQEAGRAMPKRDDRGLRLGAGLAEGGETGMAYTCFLLFPGQLGVLTAIWIAVLATTVVARTVLCRRLLAD
ncbi:MAG: CDP-alcohol phosphatidyltransferase family protein [Deltaproteobacteria bacterium]|nr:CDP-alcohol phosphatidyltransferase family protein [Deltaproteobacteria bacterium]